MSVDKKNQGLSLTDLISIPPYRRTDADIESLVKATSYIKFFQDLSEKGESSKLHYECCKCIRAVYYSENEYVCKYGDEALDFFFILHGSVRVLAKPEVPLSDQNDEDLTKIVRKNTVLNDKNPKIARYGTTSDLNYEEDEMVQKEVAVLYAGQAFGEMALDTDKPRFFSVQCIMPTLLGALSKTEYLLIQKNYEKQNSEKIEFLRSLDPFKNWSKLALQKISYFFTSVPYKKNAIVYKQGDLPTNIYFIKEGEFLFTQEHAINVGYKASTEAPGALKSKKQENIVRKKNMKIVIKQKGEIFGYEEVYEKKLNREFTCVCCSTAGELVTISDKNFTKKIQHPDVTKYIEDSYATFRKWTDQRISGLKDTEIFKDGVSFTPFSKLQPTSRSREPDNLTKLPIIHIPDRYKQTLPIILDKIIVRSRNKSYSEDSKPRYYSKTLFQTEVSYSINDNIHKKKNSSRHEVSPNTSYTPLRISLSSTRKD
jgi:CRP-like cAMP-binding protein